MSVPKISNFSVSTENFPVSNLNFPVLEFHLSKTINQINLEYNEVIKKPLFLRGDHDYLFTIILDDLMENSDKFNDNEIKIITALVKIRKNKSYIQFVKFFPIMKELFSDLQFSTRKTDIDLIMETLNFVPPPPPPSESPDIINFKYMMVCDFASPCSDDRFKLMDDLQGPPIEFN